MIDPSALEQFHALQGRVETSISDLLCTLTIARETNRVRLRRFLARPFWMKLFWRRADVIDTRATESALQVWHDARTVLEIMMPLISAHLGLDRPSARALAPTVTDLDELRSLAYYSEIDRARRSLVFPFRFTYDAAV